MHHRPLRVLVGCAIATALLLSSCSAPITHEAVPAGWELNVHQPGEWWTQPLIPRSVIVERCPPPRNWSSEPDLTKVTALPPGDSVNYMRWVDDYHCPIGWAEPVNYDESESDIDDLASETDLRRVCSTSGLPLDDSWEFLGSKLVERAGDPAYWRDPHELSGESESATAAFTDQFHTVVACTVSVDFGSGGIELSVGTDLTGAAAVPKCPVSVVDDMVFAEDNDTLESYGISGAGAVRDDQGRVLRGAKTLRIGLVGDSVQTSHPVVDGVAIVAAEVLPKTTVKADWDNPPPVEGQVLDADDKVLATCGS